MTYISLHVTDNSSFVYYCIITYYYIPWNVQTKTHIASSQVSIFYDFMLNDLISSLLLCINVFYTTSVLECFRASILS
jgi:hypothetical protein